MTRSGAGEFSAAFLCRRWCRQDAHQSLYPAAVTTTPFLIKFRAAANILSRLSKRLCNRAAFDYRKAAFIPPIC